MGKREDGVTLFAYGMIFLIVPGILYNNLVNSGLGNTNTTMTCDNTLDICTLSTPVGCQAHPGFCRNLTNKTLSFFNSNSPFTQLLQGNLFALFTNLNPLGGGGAATTQGAQTSWSGTHGPFDVTGNPVYYSADCQGQTLGPGNSRSQINWALALCVQTGTDGKNLTKAQAATLANWNTNWVSPAKNVIFANPDFGNGSFPRSCTFIQQINYTALANGPGFTYFGCAIGDTTVTTAPNQPLTRQWAYLVAMPVSYGPMPTGVSHQILFVQLTSWYTQLCIQNNILKYEQSTQCTNFLQGFKGVSIPGTTTTFVPNSAGAIVFGFLAGIILLLGGLGLQIGVGGGVSAGINPQGTKLFQSLGIGLIIWSFFFSQFSTWFTSGILPIGLDGALGIIALVIDSLIFSGVYLMTQQGTAATTS